MKILCFDPSGSFGREGSGTSGYAVFFEKELNDFGEIKASDYKEQLDYFHAHKELILKLKPERIVCESYRLHGGKAKAQSGSSLDTPRLIGYLQMVAYELKIEFILQDPSIKTRVADPILTRLGVFTKKGTKHYCMGRSTSLHVRDAIRHGLFYLRYKYKEEVK
jgi:hypothetical protein